MVEKKRKQNSKRSGRDTSIRLLVVGASPRVDAVARSLQKLKPAVERRRWTDDLAVQLDDQVLAVVLVPPLGEAAETAAKRKRRAFWHAVAALRNSSWGAGAASGVFVVLNSDSRRADVAKAYAAGASAVFEWEEDKRLLPLLLAETLGMRQARGPANNADAALERTTKARLRLSSTVSKIPRVSCSEGVVHLDGTVSDLPQRDRIAELVEADPAVRGVVTKGLRVPPTGIPDSTVLRRVRRALRSRQQVWEETISVTVDRGFVTLAGSVSSRRELEQIRSAVRDVRGVRGIDNLVVVAPGEQRQRDGTAARRLNGALSRLFPRSDLSVSAFGGVVVLAGKVPDLQSKRRIEHLVAQDEAAARVVNKLELARPSARL